MDLKELKKIIKICQKEGVKHIKMAGIELELDTRISIPSFLPSMLSDPKAKNDPILNPTQEDLLHWSDGFNPREKQETIPTQ